MAPLMHVPTVCVAVGLLLQTGALALLSENEFRLIFSLRHVYNVGFIVFVEEGSLSPSVPAAMKRISESNVAATALTADRLRTLLSRGNEHFWHRKTMLVAIRKIHLGSLLELMKNPKSTVWALFAEPVDFNSVSDQVPYGTDVVLVRKEDDRLYLRELFPSRSESSYRPFLGSDAVSYLDDGSRGRRKMNLGHVSLRVGISKELCKEGRDGMLLQMIFCYHSAILDIMAEKLKFRKELIAYGGISYSFVYPNGSYSGFFKMVRDREVNLSVAGFVITGKRLDDFDFIWPTFAMQSMMYVKKVDALRASLTGTPFATSVWTVIAAWTVAVGSFLHLCAALGTSGVAARPVDLFSSLFRAVQMTCNQGIADESSSASATRIICWTALLGGMLLYFYYSAMVLSYLTLENVDLPFSSFEELVEKGKYKVIAVVDGFPIYFVKFEMNLPGRNAKSYLISQEKLPAGVEDGLRQLCTGKYLTLLELRGTLMSIQKFECRLLEIPTPVFDEFFGFAATKKFPFVEHFTLILWQLYEVGIRQRMERNLSKFDSIPVLSDVDDNFNMVSIEQVVHLLFILNAGVALSLVLLLLEISSYRRSKCKRPMLRRV